MSMPKIVGRNIEHKQSISDIISSVSLQQAALSHILNAEGEKLQAMMKIDGVSAKELL